MSASNPYGVNGADVLVVVYGTVVGGQRGVRITRPSGAVDFSSKASVHERVRPGRLSSTVSLDSLYMVSESGHQMIQMCRDNRDMVTLRIKQLGSDIEEAQAIVTSIERDHPDQGESLFTAEFQVSDGWTTL